VLDTDRHFYLTSEKIRYQGEENDRKIFESSSPAKYKSNCTEDDSKSTEFYRPTYICKDGANISTGHKNKKDALTQLHQTNGNIKFL